MLKKINKLITNLMLVLLLGTSSMVSASESVGSGENVSKYFKQSKLVASYIRKNTNIEFYNSTKNPKLIESAIKGFKANDTVMIDIDFSLSEKSNGESYKTGDWFTVPLDGTLIDYPENDKPQYIEVAGEKIIKFYVRKMNNKPVVYFEFTEELASDKYDYFENGKINIFGNVDSKLEGSKTTTIGEDSITINFDDIKEEKEKNPGTSGTVVGYKLTGTTVNNDFDKSIFSSSITSDIIKYEFNINKNLLSNYYLDNNTKLDRDNLVLIDKLSEGLKFNEDTLSLEIKALIPLVGYKYNKDELVLENGRPIITGFSSKTISLFNCIQDFKRIYQGEESNSKFLEKINNQKYTYGITKDGKEFYLNLGDIGTNGYIIERINTDKKLESYLRDKIGTSMDTSKNDKLVDYVIEDMIKLYGEKSNNHAKAISYRVRLSAEKTRYDVNGYTNDALLNYTAEKEVSLEDSVFDKNFKATASITPGAYNSITISKTDVNNKELKLEGVKFELYKEGSKKVVATALTDSNGIAKFTRLEAGAKYIVKEVSAKAGYDVNSYKATVSDGYTIDKDGYVQIEDNPEKQGIIIYATNELLTHTVELTKKDANNNLLANTTFNLEILKGSEWTTVGTKTTNSKGLITFDGLLEGTYRFVETKATAGYNKDSFKLFNQDQEITTFTISGEETASKTFAFTATNELLTHTIEFTKYGVNSKNEYKTLENVEFALQIKIDNEWVLVDTNTTDENGVLNFNNIKPGTYRFVEIKTLTGYMADSFKLYNKIDSTYNEDGLLKSINLENVINEFTISSDLTEETVYEFVGTNLEIPVVITTFPLYGNHNNYVLPQTGDNFNRINWLLLAIISSSILLIGKYKKARN